MKSLNYRIPEGYNFLQSLHRTYRQIKDPIGAMEESMEHFNGTYSVHLGMTRFIVTQDPGFIDYVLKKNHRNYHKSEIQTDSLGRFIGYGLLTSNGEFWLRQRRLIQPGFHQEKIQALYSNIQKTVDIFLKNFPEGGVDVYPHMNRLAFDIVMNALFNIMIPERLRDELGRFISETQQFVMKDLRQPHKRWWFRLSGELRENLDKSKAARNIIRDIIMERKRSGEKRNDLLDMLLESRYEDTGEPMKEEQLIDEILVLIIAGHETTANALSWTLYLLATHPSVVETIRRTPEDPDPKRNVTDDYLMSVISESLRLFPPAYISDRVALHDDQYNGYTFPAKTIIILFYYGLHRDPKYWSNPDSFMPERFSKEKLKDSVRTFFPFGAGPRLCIGNSFAMAEMAIFLKSFVSDFEVAPLGKPPVINALVTLKPDKVFLEVRKRRGS